MQNIRGIFREHKTISNINGRVAVAGTETKSQKSFYLFNNVIYLSM